jgi:hypothetical protein
MTKVTILLNRCLATTGGFIEPLPSNNRGIFTETLPNNDRREYTDTRTCTHRHQRDLISLLYFFKIVKYAKKNENEDIVAYLLKAKVHY